MIFIILFLGIVKGIENGTEATEKKLSIDDIPDEHKICKKVQKFTPKRDAPKILKIPL